MKANVTRRSEFGTDSLTRLDAEYVDPDDLAHERALVDGLRARSLIDLASPYTGTVVNNSLQDSGSMFRYIDIDSIDTQDGMAYCDELQFGKRPSRAKYVVEENDILVSNVRPNRGAVTLVTPRLAGSIASSGFTLVRPNASDANVALSLYAYIRTHSARRQLIRRNRGSMYPAVLPRDVFDIVIPDVQHIAALHNAAEQVMVAVQLQDQFFKALEAVEAYLASFLQPFGSPPSPLDSTRDGKPDVTIVGRSAALRDSERIDAEFFRREYVEFHTALRDAGPVFELGGHYDVFTPHLTRGAEPTPTFKQSALTNAGVNWTSVLSEPGNGKVSTVREGDILLACTAHEIAYVARKVDLVRDMPASLAINQAVGELAVIRPKTSKPAGLHSSYVAAFLRHRSPRSGSSPCSA
ncbi:hypothetical protein AFM11_15845 [Mycolicibacterium wolinskyi]|uniref:Type I restriction modification DNA specificity domain-containing protein n=1 Tax=Mycolicibacterium wolinskyi TaxID=59750 RepID=A0A132PLW3_9MYCO|nr:hypothetical protein [Mycolicibacterium wolinskyi]KWX23283.1 hypothetical protein AFM11_15845 [Mycolicibacterium wolinskyi]